MENKRYFWVDNIKLFAVVFVALGHLMQSFVQSKLIYDGVAYNYFIDTIYYFHVPLFFICSGFLFQRLTKQNGFKDYGKNIIKKLIALGVPYIVFLSCTYLLKNVFSDSVNNQNNGFLYSFFVEPMAPYWFLYALFFLFLVSPILKNKADAIIRIVLTLVLFAIPYLFDISVLPAVVSKIVYYICHYLVWFVLGMEIAFFDAEKYFKKWHFVFFIVFIAGSVFAFIKGIKVPFILTLLACIGIVPLFGAIFTNKQPKVLGFLSKYTMPIFLMHTIFAAGVRAVLLKIGITSAAIHIPAGLIAGIFAPIIAGMIMEKIKLDILYQPTKYIKIK